MQQGVNQSIYSSRWRWLYVYTLIYYSITNTRTSPERQKWKNIILSFNALMVTSWFWYEFIPGISTSWGSSVVTLKALADIPLELLKCCLNLSPLSVLLPYFPWCKVRTGTRLRMPIKYEEPPNQHPKEVARDSFILMEWPQNEYC